MPTTVADLESLGFQGFVNFAQLPVSEVPSGPGVYAVVRTSIEAPEFLTASPAGQFKGRDPSVSSAMLRDAWVPGVQILYIGKASRGKSLKRGLRIRLDEYRRYGEGQPIGHQGGRYIWQLTDSGGLLVGWLETPDRDARAVEKGLIADFVHETGSRPFANRQT
jgi:hypothetical protein